MQAARVRLQDPAQLAPAPRPSASGPRCASSASACSGVSSQTPARFFEPASVRTSSRAVGEPEAERRRLRALLAGAEVAKAAGGHQVDEQDELAVLGREEEPLRAPLGAGQPPALERGAAAGRTSSASRRAPARRARSATRSRARRGPGATPPPRGAQATRFLAMGPIRVTVRRGGVVEAIHLAHAVAVEDGRIVESAGDPELLTFYRSSSKPLQALPLARERDDVADRELAIACASHRAEPAQLEAVASLLAKAPASEDELELGPQEGRGSSLLAHNCSGKHAGFLAVCRARGWPSRGLPARLAPDAAAPARGRRRSGRGRGGRRPERGRRLRCAHVRAHARADGPLLLAPRAAPRAATAWSRRCAPTPSWSGTSAARSTPS